MCFKSSFQVTGISSSGVVKTCIILVLESHDNNEFSFEFLHPEENFDATLHENFNDLDKHLINDRTVLIETLKRTESGYSPSPSNYIHKSKVKRSFAERQTRENLRQSRKDVGSFEGLSVIIKRVPQSQELISLDRNILQIF